MILYYAVGGGLGHLTRARAVIHTLGRGDPVAVLSASPWIRDRRVVGDWRPVALPPELARDRRALRGWLLGTLEELAPAEIWVDAFPGGIQGELCGFPWPPGIRLRHVARLLRWDRYAAGLRGELPAYERTWVVEPLGGDHRAVVERHSASVEPLTLADPPPERTFSPGELIADPFWLVVHSGSEEEVLELVAFAREIREREAPGRRLVLVAPSRPCALPAEVEHCDHYPASDFFPFAERIVTACGFNAMRQTEPFRDRHRFLPFERQLDDQFRRASRRRQMP